MQLVLATNNLIKDGWMRADQGCRGLRVRLGTSYIRRRVAKVTWTRPPSTPPPCHIVLRSDVIAPEAGLTGRIVELKRDDAVLTGRIVEIWRDILRLTGRVVEIKREFLDRLQDDEEHSDETKRRRGGVPWGRYRPGVVEVVEEEG